MLIKYKIKRDFKGLKGITQCPNGNDCAVSSHYCQQCGFFMYDFPLSKILVCRFKKNLKYKINYVPPCPPAPPPRYPNGKEAPHYKKRKKHG